MARRPVNIGAKGFWYISPIMLRILAVNVGALLILGLGLLYSGQYERELIKTEQAALLREGRLLASALAEGGVRPDEEGVPMLAEDLSRHMLRKLAENNPHRTIVFKRTGELLVDSHQMLGPGGVVEIAALEPPWQMLPLRQKLNIFLERALDFLPIRLRLPRIRHEGGPGAQNYPKMIEALSGQSSAEAWRDADGRVMLTVAMSIQDLKNVLGGVLLMKNGSDIDTAVRDVQMLVIKLFVYALLVTVFMSVYLSHTIARPLMRLAQAAAKVRQSLLFRDAVPDFSYRNDEIGTLSRALRAMTDALAERLNSISSFAADVAHEIKNPLASVKSAVETLARVQDEGQRTRLLNIINADVDRMNRLITDISHASRLDSEVVNAQKADVDLEKLLTAVAGFAQQAHHVSDKVRLHFAHVPKPVLVEGNEVQIYQVMENLLSNALSFVTPEGKVDIAVYDEGARLMVHIDNDGPPIPENKLEAIFARFYTERPRSEKFGQHSGLGLSISRHIVKAHQGVIFASNLRGDDGRERGVRFTVILPKGKNS